MSHPHAPAEPTFDTEKVKADVIDFITNTRLAMLVTSGKDGYPMARMMGYLNEGLSIWFTTFNTSLKIKQMSENNKVTVLWKEPFEENLTKMRFVTLKGTIKIFSDLETVTSVRTRYAEKYNTPSIAAVDDTRVVMKLTPTYLRAEGFGVAPPPIFRAL
jgi:general stress protein 26